MKKVIKILMMLLILSVAKGTHASNETVLSTPLSEALKSDTVCICRNEAVIDSILKIIQVYPVLRKAYEAAVAKIKADGVVFTESQNAILFALRMSEDWNLKQVKREIRKLRRRRLSDWIVSGLTGAAIGAIIIAKTTIR